jgi:hypothetical protein
MKSIKNHLKNSQVLFVLFLLILHKFGVGETLTSLRNNDKIMGQRSQTYLAKSS